ncbi:hypothetical protein J5J83_10565 [Azoarcus sp. L1K30]|uniref:hypothetical protein n=1 Tax=Azoarcus sp. L1K30 TaxID=2820277 RepID=UPI001B81E9D9|nr:hypothetical protein [Azoarcus sp. L1K30]MBR0566556.1 hypothetical protein [Azoarcus sp. L1K30]
MSELALILYHKQSTSARLRFARFGDSVVAARIEAPADEAVRPHPGPLTASAADRMGLPAGALQIDPEFEADMLSPSGTLSVRLAHFTDIDPPFDAVASAQGRFVSITEMRGIPDTERDVLRLVYEHVIG